MLVNYTLDLNSQQQRPLLLPQHDDQLRRACQALSGTAICLPNGRGSSRKSLYCQLPLPCQQDVRRETTVGLMVLFMLPRRSSVTRVGLVASLTVVGRPRRLNKTHPPVLHLAQLEAGGLIVQSRTALWAGPTRTPAGQGYQVDRSPAGPEYYGNFCPTQAGLQAADESNDNENGSVGDD